MSMTDLERLAELAMRVEGMTGPDREVDAAIQAALTGAVAEWQDYKQANAYHRDGKWVNIGEIKPYTGSLDAAMALVPGTCLAILKQLWASDGQREWYAIIQQYQDGMYAYQVDALHPSAAIAMTAALLKALAAKSREVG